MHTCVSYMSVCVCVYMWAYLDGCMDNDQTKVANVGTGNVDLYCTFQFF